MKTIVQIAIILSSLIAILSCVNRHHQNDMSYKINELLRIENPTESIIKLDSILNERSNYGEKIELLSNPEKVVVFVESLEREVNNEGFNQFFFNSSGDFAEETLEA